MENNCLKSHCLDERAKFIQEIKQLHEDIEALKRERNRYRILAFTGAILLTISSVINLLS